MHEGGSGCTSLKCITGTSSIGLSTGGCLPAPASTSPALAFTSTSLGVAVVALVVFLLLLTTNPCNSFDYSPSCTIQLKERGLFVGGFTRLTMIGGCASIGFFPLLGLAATEDCLACLEEAPLSNLVMCVSLFTFPVHHLMQPEPML